ncbi:RnaseH-domain-containing protein [Auriscalpium vulgare]|uniref:RnaseH-domain-containing protein n=1 Tax=Auriscalpium vulgare TaxID=40419 RepID=A0ACB8RXH8_9AGAM|nr:RnaseH-domain-containing protein [Auriscalpium vulgare]
MRRCACRDCARDRARGCENPHACAAEARSRIDLIHQKLNPTDPPPQISLTLTRHRKRQNLQNLELDREVKFDPATTCKTNLSECIRIFQTDDPESTSPPTRLTGPPPGISLPNERITIYTDGSCINNGKKNAQCGSGVWVDDDHELNQAFRVPGDAQSNQVGELVAIIITLQKVENYIPIRFKTDSKYVINGLTKFLPKYEDIGWIGIANAELFQVAAFLLRRRSAPTTFQWVKGHSGIAGNENADEEAGRGAHKDAHDELNLDIDDAYRLRGAKLAALTQAEAYKGIRERVDPKRHPPRESTRVNLERARCAVEEATGALETDAALWKNTYRPEIKKPVQQFLFKTIHNIYMVGRRWRHSLPERAPCPLCGDLDESMEHILTECPNSPIMDAIWRAARELWPHGEDSWPQISFAAVIGCGSLEVPAPENEGQEERATRAARSRLLRILISESAHLIWVLRCERVIQEKQITTREALARWTFKINQRLITDKILSSRKRRSKKARYSTTLTWTGTLRDERDLPDDWAVNPEVLVGIRPPRAPI